MNAVPGPDPPAVHFRGVVLGPSGFAAQGREWLALLERAGLAPSLHGARLGPVAGGESAAERALIERCAARRPAADRITVHHVLPPHFAPDPEAAADLVITVFETRGLPPGWGPSLDRAAAVVVPAPAIRDAFVRGGVTAGKVHAIPPPVDLTGFAPGTCPLPGLPPRRPRVRRLLAVLDWSLRKGIDVLLPAFARACGPHEAELLLKVAPRPDLDRRGLQARCRAIVAAARTGVPPAVHVLDPLLPREALPSLYAGCDGLVLPSRGEGWGRPVHEAMAMGLPVIATQAGALRTLLPDATVGYPVRTELAAVGAAAAAETPVFAGQEWWEPDPVDLIRQLRAWLADPVEARARGARARDHIRALCAEAAVAAAFREVLYRAGAQPGSSRSSASGCSGSTTGTSATIGRSASAAACRRR